jgi:heme o synthase
LSGIVQDYFHLMKPGIMVLLVFEAITAMIVATGRSVSIIGLGLLALVGILSSGGASALNQYLEWEKDIKMSRTDWRPIANKRITPRSALAFGSALTALGVGISYITFNLVTALMISLGALSYVFLYTVYLKPRTHWNIVVGGVAGVFPALTGWAAATGVIGWPGLFIGLIVFLWTPPHFWGLSMKYKEDYQRTGFPMLPVVKTETQVVKWIVFSSIPLFILTLFPLVLPLLGTYDLIYYLGAAAMAVAFLAVDVKMWRKPTKNNGFLAFIVSLPYLFVLFSVMIVSSVI